MSQKLCHGLPGSLFWISAAWVVKDTNHGDQGVCISSSPCLTLHYTLRSRSVCFSSPRSRAALLGSTVSTAGAPESEGKRGCAGQADPSPSLTLSLSLHRLTPHYVYPQAIIQPSVVIPTPVQSITSPYIDYTAASQAYSQYTTAAYDQYPYAASPAAGFVGYGYTTGTVQPPLSAGTPAAPAAAFVQYQPQQLQPDRMQ